MKMNNESSVLFESANNKRAIRFAWVFIPFDATLKLLKSQATHRIIISHQDIDA